MRKHVRLSYFAKQSINFQPNKRHRHHHHQHENGAMKEKGAFGIGDV